jgi:hypothetical protein
MPGRRIACVGIRLKATIFASTPSPVAQRGYAASATTFEAEPPRPALAQGGLRIMDENRKRVFGQAFAAMSTIWTYFEPTTLRISVWNDALSDLSHEELALGFSWVIKNHSGNQPPTPGEIRDAVKGPLVKQAVTRSDGKVIRWEQKRLKPLIEKQPMSIFTGGVGRLSGPYHKQIDYED